MILNRMMILFGIILANSSIQKHPGFESLEDCRKFAENALKGTNTVF